MVTRAKIKPLSGYALIEPQEAEEVTASGIVLPDTAQEKPAQGLVLAIGAPTYVEGKEIKPVGYSAACDYHPDLDDPASREQAEGIKARLRDLGWGARGGWDQWDEKRRVFRWEVFGKGKKYSGESKLSEGSALVAAVAKLVNKRSKK